MLYSVGTGSVATTIYRGITPLLTYTELPVLLLNVPRRLNHPLSMVAVAAVRTLAGENPYANHS